MKIYPFSYKSQLIPTQHWAWRLVALLGLVGCGADAGYDDEGETAEVSQAMRQEEESGLNGDHHSIEQAVAELKQKEEQDRFGRIALHMAAKEGRVDVVRALLDQGAQVDAPDRVNHTPLYYAAREHQVRVVELLLERGADFTKVMTFPEPTVVQTLLEGGVDSLKFFNHPNDRIREIAQQWQRMERERLEDVLEQVG